MADSRFGATSHWILYGWDAKINFRGFFHDEPLQCTRMQNHGAGGPGTRKTLHFALHYGNRAALRRDASGDGHWAHASRAPGGDYELVWRAGRVAGTNCDRRTAPSGRA